MTYKQTADIASLNLPPQIQKEIEKFLEPPPLILQGQQPDPPPDPLRSGGAVWSEKRLFVCTEDGKSVPIAIKNGDIVWQENADKGDLLWIDDTAPNNETGVRFNSNSNVCLPVPSWHTPEIVAEFAKRINPGIEFVPDFQHLDSAGDVKFSEHVRTDQFGIGMRVTIRPRGYCISLDQECEHLSISFHPNLIKGDVYPDRSGWNIPCYEMKTGGAFALVRWENKDDWPPDRQRETIYEHWLKTLDTDEKQKFWDSYTENTEYNTGW